MRILLLIAPLALIASACGDLDPLPANTAPQPPAGYAVTVQDVPTITEALPQTATPPPPAAPAPDVRILQTTFLDRPAEVVGIIELRVESGRADEGLGEMRRKAAALGAQAVVGVELRQGSAPGEPSRLTGLAVRFLPAAP